MRTFFLLIGIILSFHATALMGQSNQNQYTYSYLNVEDGLCDNNINYIYKDKQGFMWIATINGLDRYDGCEVTHYCTFAEIPHRLKGNFVKELIEDNHDQMWIASESGLMCLGLLTGKIESFENMSIQNASLLNQSIQTLFKDNDGNIWFGHDSGMAYLTQNETGAITKINIVDAAEGHSIHTICQHGYDIWAAGHKTLLHLVKSSRGNFIELPESVIQQKSANVNINCLFSFDEHIWIGTQSGLISYNTLDNTSDLYKHNPSDNKTISGDIIICIDKNKSGELIVGTTTGLNVYKRNNLFVHYKKGAEDRSLNNNLIKSVYVDENNYIWIGTEVGGVNLMIPQKINFEYQLQGNDDDQNLISSVFEDRAGNLLVGIVGGGLAVRLKGQSKFNTYLHSANNNSLSNNDITAIIQDGRGDYWISTKGGGLNRLKNQNLRQPVFERFTMKSHAIGSDEIMDLTIDTLRNGLWFCYPDGVEFMSFATNHFSKLKYTTENSEPLQYLSTLHIDRNSRLWIGGRGLYVVDLKLADAISGKYFCKYFKYKFDDPSTKIQEKISCIFESQNGTMYFGSQGNGIYFLENDSGTNYIFHNYAITCGLSDTMVFNILEDNNTNLWISTINGVYLFNTTLKRAFKFDAGDGLYVHQFYMRAGCKMANGHLCLGTIDGIVDFNPPLNFSEFKTRKVILTAIRYGMRELVPYMDPDNIDKSVSMVTTFNIYPPEYSFEITFSSLDYSSQNKIFFAYRLKNYDDKWIVRLGERSAKYANLPPGEYFFQVLCTNPDNTWSNSYTSLKIIIHPPFYRSFWFYTISFILILVLIVGGIYLYGREQKRKQRFLEFKIVHRTKEITEQKIRLEQSQQAMSDQNRILQLQNKEIRSQKDQLVEFSQKMEKVNKDKMLFFTNLTHEFKTPLTLILGPVSSLIERTDDAKQLESLNVIQRNARHLLSLINQLMDIRNVDNDNFKLSLEDFDFTEFVESVIEDFSNILNERNIKLETRIRMHHSIIKSDNNNLHKVIFNLLSNAVKFTPNGGNIIIRIAQIPDNEIQGQMIQYISITNSGSWIAQNEIDSIFDRFYIIPNQKFYTSYGQSSTGIGLYLVKQIITSLGGVTKVKSNNHGVTFRVHFPIQFSHEVHMVKLRTDYQEHIPLEQDDDILFTITHKNKPILLLVEDNRDMRTYIKNMLADRYNVAEAINGEKGLALAMRILPDFIVSDLMMPICDGIEFCREVKNDETLCHIPFLLLTAQSGDHAKIKSYNTGVDGYLTKPFLPEMLFARIDGILKNRDKSRQRLLKKISSHQNINEQESPDNRFLELLMSVMKDNFDNPEFGVSELCSRMNMSNTLLYKKIVSSTGLSASRFILLYRLQSAKELMETGSKINSLNVSEIAYKVGFNDPKYFSRCFVRRFNRTPSAML